MSEYGDPRLPERFWNKISTGESGCWIWTANRDTGGYGVFRVNNPRRTVRAHRHSYEHLVGAIPAGLHIDHLCRVRACVNPAHLEPVTQRENLLRGATIPAAMAAKTHCIRGHPLSGENLRLKRSGRGCRQCQRDRDAARPPRERSYIAHPRPPVQECVHGHPYTAENTIFEQGGKVRRCRACRRKTGQRRRNRVTATRA